MANATWKLRLAMCKAALVALGAVPLLKVLAEHRLEVRLSERTSQNTEGTDINRPAMRPKQA